MALTRTILQVRLQCRQRTDDLGAVGGGNSLCYDIDSNDSDEVRVDTFTFTFQRVFSEISSDQRH
jgi:hypothetical protein